MSFLSTSILTPFLLIALNIPSIALSKELAKVDNIVISTESAASALRALGPQGEMVLSNPELRKKFIDHMINSQLVARKAKAEGFEKNPAFQARLADVTVQLMAGEYMDHMLAKKSSEKSIKSWFDQNKQLFSKREIQAMHILCSDESTASKVLAEVEQSPAEFEKVAKKYSADKTIDLGYFGHGQMAPEFEQAAFSTKVGAIYSKPVKTSFGWHVIKVLAERGDDDVKYETVKVEAARKYRQKLQEDFIRELRGKSKIAINELSLKEIKLP